MNYGRNSRGNSLINLEGSLGKISEGINGEIMEDVVGDISEKKNLEKLKKNQNPKIRNLRKSS